MVGFSKPDRPHFEGNERVDFFPDPLVPFVFMSLLEQVLVNYHCRHLRYQDVHFNTVCFLPLLLFRGSPPPPGKPIRVCIVLILLKKDGLKQSSSSLL